MNINITITQEMIQTAVIKAVEDSFKSSYSNPVREAVDAELKGVDGQIRNLVKTMITNAISDPAFKDQMQKTVIEKLVMKAMNSKE
jgi:hypothetical protein